MFKVENIIWSFFNRPRTPFGSPFIVKKLQKNIKTSKKFLWNVLILSGILVGKIEKHEFWFISQKNIMKSSNGFSGCIQSQKA
jgi:hypothetical protein